MFPIPGLAVRWHPERFSVWMRVVLISERLTCVSVRADNKTSEDIQLPLFFCAECS